MEGTGARVEESEEWRFGGCEGMGIMEMAGGFGGVCVFAGWRGAGECRYSDCREMTGAGQSDAYPLFLYVIMGRYVCGYGVLTGCFSSIY